MCNVNVNNNGQIISALICMYDLSGFARFSRSVDMKTMYCLLRDVAAITSDNIQHTSGTIIKYIGDAALILFPEESVDEGVRILLVLKQELENHLKKMNYITRNITFSLHFGEVIMGKLRPFDYMDVFGNTVNTAFLLDRGNYRGKFVISPQVFRKLKPETRKKFHKFTPPIVYLAG